MERNNRSNKATKVVLNKIIDSNFLIEGATIIVGFSGGPDSLCLLHALTLLRERIDFDIYAVHVNHKLRGEKSDLEEEHAKKICKDLEVDIYTFEVDCAEMAEEMHESIESVGRQARYVIFDEVVGLLDDDNLIDPDNVMIATAHNADDQSETVLYRLIRGTGPSGLEGIKSVRMSNFGYPIIRPLLEVTRDEIEAYIEANNLVPNIDESNFELDATRNKIRHMLIPYIEKNFNPSIKETLRRIASNVERDNYFLEELTVEHLNDTVMITNEEDGISLKYDVAEFYAAPPSIIYRAVKEILNDLIDDEEITTEHIRNVVRLGSSDNPSAYIELPGDFVAKRDYRNLIFTKKSNLKNEDLINGLRLGTQIASIGNYCPLDGELNAAFDYDAFNSKYVGMAGHIKLRTRQPGDYIAMKDGKRKKLQDFFVDSKISKDKRDSIILAAIDNEVLWILPNSNLPTKSMRQNGKFSQNYQITDTTKRVLILEIIDTL